MDTDQDTQTVIKTEQDTLSIMSYPESLDQETEDIKPLRTDVSIEIEPVEPHCLNCGREISQKKRHKLAQANVEVIAVIRKWIAPQLIGEDDQICHSCFTISLRQTNIDVPDKTSNDRPRQLCLTCQRSLLRKRFHLVNSSTEMETNIRNVVMKEIAPKQLGENDKICHPCWQKWFRRVLAPPEPKELPSVIHLPNIMRAPGGQRSCFYPDCGSSRRHVVPRWLRIKLFTEYKFYVPHNCRLCSYHLTNPNWDIFKSYPKAIHRFTTEHVEDFASFVNERYSTMDFNNIDGMEDEVVKYFIGLTKVQFKNVYALLPQLKKFKNGQVALAAYLMRLKTGDSIIKIANLVNVPRSTLSRTMDLVRTLLQNLPDNVVPPEIGNHINNDDDENNDDDDDENNGDG